MKTRRKRRPSVAVLNRDGHTIGLDIGATAVRATVLAPRIVDGRPSVTMHGTGTIDLAPGVVVNGVIQEPTALTAALKQLWHQNKFPCTHVILGVANQQVLVRGITIPDLDPQQRTKALPYQAREVVALPIDQVVLDFAQIGAADPATNTVHGLLLATPREPVLSAVTAVERAGLKVARVDLSSFGSLRSLAEAQPSDEAIIDLGAHLTTIVIHQQGVPRLVRTLARGGEQLTQQLADRMAISQPDAEAVKREIGLLDDGSELSGVLREAVRPLIAEIHTSVQYFRSANEGAHIARMSLTGGGSALRGVAAALERQTGLRTEVVDPLQHVGNRGSDELEHDPSTALSAVSVGLAMGAAA